ncbi:hypothetical protein DIJ64_11730 [Mycobacterium leprae]|uniref:Uncharacterized protein n=1 Tax=Mycobacterium leprae TaxID=1769 RepID=O33053_MYCLR|nr:hypothetical protein DIJ64_11730 [Mycobacterium leprae]OAR21347.1 hypothetical protein A8144_06505 [Mycobacterium leprae 3125609]OAX71517.1 hypothetical protein A3216_05365 [Mycobacterium leprae 7935681]CAB16652.1 hypothetical protein MLCB57.12 [Mycobacterium leprae]
MWHRVLNVFSRLRAQIHRTSRSIPDAVFTKLDFYRELPPVLDGYRNSLIWFSYGRGNNGHAVRVVFLGTGQSWVRGGCNQSLPCQHLSLDHGLPN